MKYYYILIMMFSSGLMGMFALLGSNGTLSPFLTITGIIASIVGMIGSGIDMKHRNRKESKNGKWWRIV